jgi:hypothetical protein
MKQKLYLFIASFFLTIISNAQIVISEIMYNPPESGTDLTEYIELYNNGNSLVNLTGYSFSQGVTHTFTGGSINPGEYFVITVNSTELNNTFGPGTADAQWTSGTLTNIGESIGLLDDLGNQVDFVTYSNVSPWPTLAAGQGSSLKLCHPSVDNSNYAYWTASNDATGIIVNGWELKCSPGTSGTIISCPTPSTSTATHLNFDGINDYVVLPLDNIEIPTTNFTHEFWFQTTDLNGTMFTSSTGTLSSPSGWDKSIYLNNGKVVAYIWTGAPNTLTTTASYNDGSWHHVAHVVDANGSFLYLDGNLEVSNTISASTFTSNTEITLGVSPLAGGSYFFGNLEDLRIWNVAKTVTQINAIKNCELQGNETGLVAYYKFNQGIDGADNTAITTLLDATSNANNGSFYGFALNGINSNFLAGSSITTGSVVPEVATVTTPIVYCLGATATALNATTGTNGTGLLWYTTASGGTGTTIAPTPSTSTAGNTSYWVSSTNTNGCESLRTLVNVTVNTTPAPTVDAGPATVTFCSDAIIPITAIATTSPISSNGFQGVYAPSNWALVNSNANGYVNTTNAPTSITLTGGNNNSFSPGNTSYSFTFATNTTISFNWNYITSDIAFLDNPKIIVNGVATFMQGFSNVGSNNQSGTMIVNVLAGQTFAFNMYSFDNDAFSANVTISNLVITNSNVSYSWTATNGGSISGSTNTATMTPATSGTYNVTVTNSAGCTNTDNVVVVINTTTVPTVSTPVVYTQGATASALTATSGGIGLLWYTTATGGMGDTTAPTPSTVNPGNISYWVSSTNANGCESARIELVVQVNAPLIPGCWAKIAAGRNHSIAIAQNGTLWSWGGNGAGQLGLGDVNDRNTPTQVGNDSNWQSVSCGGFHSMALKTDGTLWSSGYNANGQLGLGDTAQRNTLSQVGTDTNWQSVACGDDHTVAIKTNGTHFGLGDIMLMVN